MRRSHLDHGLSALQAIALSERENRSVHLEYSDALAADLGAECDDNTDAGRYVDYWGADSEDGMAWRVMLHREVV